jgi:hypothetical protein
MAELTPWNRFQVPEKFKNSGSGKKARQTYHAVAKPNRRVVVETQQHKIKNKHNCKQISAII